MRPKLLLIICSLLLGIGLLLLFPLSQTNQSGTPGVLLFEHCSRFWALGQSQQGRLPRWPTVLQTNQYGMRSDSAVFTRQPGSPLLLILGDTKVCGEYLAYEQTLGVQLGAALSKASGQAWQVLNAGVPGYSLVQSHNWLSQIRRSLRPELVVYVYGNSSECPASLEDYVRCGSPRLQAMRNLLSLGWLGRKLVLSPLSDSFGPYAKGIGLEKTRVSLAVYRFLLPQLGDMARSAKARQMLYVFLPDCSKPRQNMAFTSKGDAHGPIRLLRPYAITELEQCFLEAAPQSGALVDVHNQLYQQNKVADAGLYFDPQKENLSAAGNQLAAQIIVQQMQKRQLYSF